MIDLFIQIRVFDIIDIILVAALFFGLYRLLKGTSAMSIFIGIVAIFLIWQLVKFLQMEMLTAILGAFVEARNLPLGKYDIARLAYEIERIDLGMAGGRQDQYAATFGGVNFMEFLSDDRVIVNPLSIPDHILNEWALNTVLLYTNKRRESARIIEEQVANVKKNNNHSVEAMHKVKEEAFRIKKCLLQNKLHELGPALNTSWVNKKKMAGGISNDYIDRLYETALAAGATGGKISGAGGGGFMFFYCPGNTRYAVEEALNQLQIGEIYDFEFCKEGLTTWTAPL